MTAIELKNILMRQIKEIDDVSFLKALKTILDSKTERSIIHLTKAQHDEIISSKKEIEEGLFIDEKELDEEIKVWLNGK